MYDCKGSQFQIRAYVNTRQPELSDAVLRVIPDLSPDEVCLEWVSPLESAGCAEYRDSAFLEKLGLSNQSEALRRFWPSGGPHWDALAIVRSLRMGDHRGVVLGEAKNYPRESYETGTRSSGTSRKLIEQSLRRTQEWLGLEALDWTRAGFQYANRLAHLFFLREVCRISAWFITFCFVDDLEHQPTSRRLFEQGMRENKQRLGLGSASAPGAHELYLPALKRSEVVGQSWGSVGGEDPA